jgi:hypothetical protein
VLSYVQHPSLSMVSTRPTMRQCVPESFSWLSSTLLCGCSTVCRSTPGLS